MSAPRNPAVDAEMDQAMAAARDAVTPHGGKIVDTRDALLTVVVDRCGFAHTTVTTTDLRWIAGSLARLAATADERATAAGQ